MNPSRFCSGCKKRRPGELFNDRAPDCIDCQRRRGGPLTARTIEGADRAAETRRRFAIKGQGA